MTRREDEPQEIVADVVVDGVLDRRHRVVAFVVQVAAQLLVLAFQALAAAELVDRPVLCGRHQPGAGVVGHAGLGPALERGDERFLRELLGGADVAHDTCEPRDQAGRFDPKHGLDRAVGV